MATNETKKWITLDEVIKEYLSQAELNMAHYRRIFNIAFRGLEDLSFNVFQQPKSVQLPVLPNLTVRLPGDYINYTKVGVMNENGEVATLMRNDNLTLNGVELSTRLDDNTDGQADLSNIRDFVYLNYDNNGGLYNLQGIGSFLVGGGEFKVDDNLGLILLDNSFSYSYIILEYLSSPREDESFKIPIQVKEALIAWIAWKDIQYKVMGRRFQEVSKNQRWQDYKRERNKARRVVNPVRLWEANDVLRMNDVLAVKG